MRFLSQTPKTTRPAPRNPVRAAKGTKTETPGYPWVRSTIASVTIKHVVPPISEVTQRGKTGPNGGMTLFNE